MISYSGKIIEITVTKKSLEKKVLDDTDESGGTILSDEMPDILKCEKCHAEFLEEKYLKMHSCLTDSEITKMRTKKGSSPRKMLAPQQINVAVTKDSVSATKLSTENIVASFTSTNESSSSILGILEFESTLSEIHRDLTKE